MKRITILTEDFFLIESDAAAGIKQGYDILKDIESKCSVINPTGEIRIDPDYVNIKSEIQPVQTCQNTINKIVNMIASKRDNFPVKLAGTLMVLSNGIDEKQVSTDDELSTNIDDVIKFLGGYENCNYNDETKELIITPIGMQYLRNKLGRLREICARVPADLNSFASLNNVPETVGCLKKIMLIKNISDTI